jgi:hypothetical protein
VLAALLAACSPEQSREVGNAPKQKLERVTTDVQQSLQQGADRSRDADDKK